MPTVSSSPRHSWYRAIHPETPSSPASCRSSSRAGWPRSSIPGSSSSRLRCPRTTGARSTADAWPEPAIPPPPDENEKGEREETSFMAMADNIVVAEMSWTEVDEALKERPVAILPVGAIEAHGPHLPVTADSIIATEMAQRGAKKLKEHGVSALILPPVNFSVADFGADFAGTITVTP